MSTDLTFSARSLDPCTRGHLATVVTDGKLARLPGRIGADEYLRVKVILQLLGGVWSTRLQAFVFATDPTPLISQTLKAAAVPLHPDQAAGSVRTPEHLAEVMCSYSYLDLRFLPDDARVLEPSAGDGRLVTAILDTNPHLRVTAVEPDPGRAEVLTGIRGVDVVCGRFEDAAAAWAAGGTRFDAVCHEPAVRHARQPCRVDWPSDAGLGICSSLAPGWPLSSLPR